MCGCHVSSVVRHAPSRARRQQIRVRDAMAAYRAARARCEWQPQPLASGLGAASSSSSSSSPGADAAPADLCYRATNSTRGLGDCREHDDLRALYHHASGHSSVPDAFSHTHSFHPCTGVKGRHASSTRRSGRRREREGGDEGCLVGCRGTSSKLGPLADHTGPSFSI
jgi:hypothetical protein